MMKRLIVLVALMLAGCNTTAEECHAYCQHESDMQGRKFRMSWKNEAGGCVCYLECGDGTYERLDRPSCSPGSRNR